MPPHIVLVCKVVLAVTLCSSSGKLGLTPQQAADILRANAPRVEVELSAAHPNEWHRYTYVERRAASAPAVAQQTIVNVTVNVAQPRSYLDELRAQGALVYQIPRPYVSPIKRR